ncbi:MAG: type I glyceraldehyde-3-phosphate dehydrogenase [Oscillospiraceae bacterium]|jgi:glyceraldehyde 3-phosphate dehydrogenase|nr:type I glyceraldehyde-3-phosphate dehydrogenase [Oscillospiraceae bacterium]
MAARIAINGFGRIGRLAFRQMFGTKDVDIVAINDLAAPEMLAHLLKYDTTQGHYNADVTYNDHAVCVNGTEIAVLSQRNPENLPWREDNVDIVLECTGMFASRERSMAHIRAGAKKVVVAAPAGKDVKTVVYGVNEGIMAADDLIISSGSCTTNCLALMARELHKFAPIRKGFMTTIHAYTNDQSTLDAPHAKGDKRRARSAAGNIVPTTTGAAKAIGLVIPDLDGKLDGVSQRVPVMTGSLTELTAVVDRSVTADEINAVMRNGASESLGYTQDEIVSSDIVGMTFGALFDATLTKTSGLDGRTLVRVSAWYDNESSHTAQMVRTTRHWATL